MDTICDESSETILACDISDEGSHVISECSDSEHFDHVLRQRISRSAICRGHVRF